MFIAGSNIGFTFLYHCRATKDNHDSDYPKQKLHPKGVSYCSPGLAPIFFF